VPLAPEAYDTERLLLTLQSGAKYASQTKFLVELAVD
jgi:hypothetical protein